MVELFDPTSPGVNPLLFNRLFGFRAIGSSPSTVGFASAGPTIDGQSNIVLQPGEQVWLKAVSTGYTVVLDTRKAATPTVLLPTTGAIVLDFAAGTRRTLDLSGNVTATTANLTAGALLQLRITNNTATAYALTPPASWRTPAGTSFSIPAGKVLRVALESFGTTDASVDAATALLN